MLRLFTAGRIEWVKVQNVSKMSKYSRIEIIFTDLCQRLEMDIIFVEQT